MATANSATGQKRAFALNDVSLDREQASAASGSTSIVMHHAHRLFRMLHLDPFYIGQLEQFYIEIAE